MKKLLLVIFLSSCKCGPAVNGVKPKCEWLIPPTKVGLVFGPVTFGVQLGEQPTLPGPITVPNEIFGVPINTK